MFLCLFFLITNGVDSDTTTIDSLQKMRYEIPKIVDFSTTGTLDSSLNQTRVIEPVIFLSGFYDIFQHIPYLLIERVYMSNLLSPYPSTIFINSHYLDNYFLNFNFITFPVNFIKSFTLNKKYTISGVNIIDINTKFNSYDQPYSCLYFTLFGLNTIYNIDFTRAITNSTGFYLGGHYARQYKSLERLYLSTKGGYANIYYNQFMPMRLDIILADNSYDTIINFDFSDIALTGGKDFYKFLIFRTAIKLCDTVDENQFLTYGTQHKILFYLAGFENIFEICALENQFNPAKFKNNSIVFTQNTNYKFRNVIAGVGYDIDYGANKIYLEPAARLGFQILSDAEIFVRSGLFNRGADFVARYGNEKFIHRFVNIKGNPEIKDEAHFHREIGIVLKNSVINLYNSRIKNQIIYQLEGTGSYSAVNIDNTITGIEGLFVFPTIKGFSATGVCNYLLYSDFPLEIPDLFVKLVLNWQRKTMRSEVNIFTRFNFIDKRYDASGNSYEAFYTISPGLTIEFLTFNLSVIIENVTDTRAGDFPNMVRNFGMEIKWEFWD
ncbi:MAG: hypothetical protein ABIL46_04720 [candidate division WOR-3 bacterium]